MCAVYAMQCSVQCGVRTKSGGKNLGEFAEGEEDSLFAFPDGGDGTASADGTGAAEDTDGHSSQPLHRLKVLCASVSRPVMPSDLDRIVLLPTGARLSPLLSLLLLPLRP